jgi:hypothetical protein
VWGGQSGTSAGFLREPRIPLQISIAMNSAYTSIKRLWYNTPTNDRLQMGPGEFVAGISGLGRVDQI